MPNKIPRVLALHELHIWRLNQTKPPACVHITLDREAVLDFDGLLKTVWECFDTYSVHSVTIQSEVQTSGKSIARETRHAQGVGKRQPSPEELRQCKVSHGNLRVGLTCCQ